MNGKQAKTIRAFVKFMTHQKQVAKYGGLVAKYVVDKSTIRNKIHYSPLDQVKLEESMTALREAKPDMDQDQLMEAAYKAVPPTFQQPTATIIMDRRSSRAYYKHLKKIGFKREDVYATCTPIAQ